MPWAFEPSPEFQRARARIVKQYGLAKQRMDDARKALAEHAARGELASEKVRECVEAEMRWVPWMRLAGVLDLVFEEGVTEEHVWGALRGKLREQERHARVRSRRDLPSSDWHAFLHEHQARILAAWLDDVRLMYGGPGEELERLWRTGA